MIRLSAARLLRGALQRTGPEGPVRDQE